MKKPLLPAFFLRQLLLKPRAGQSGVLLGQYAPVTTMINALPLRCFRSQDHRRSPELPYGGGLPQRC